MGTHPLGLANEPSPPKKSSAFLGVGAMLGRPPSCSWISKGIRVSGREDFSQAGTAPPTLLCSCKHITPVMALPPPARKGYFLWGGYSRRGGAALHRMWFSFEGRKEKQRKSKSCREKTFSRQQKHAETLLPQAGISSWRWKRRPATSCPGNISAGILAAQPPILARTEGVPSGWLGRHLAGPVSLLWGGFLSRRA